MKKFILTLFALFFVKGMAQDPQLFENTWFLQKLIVDQVEYDFPFEGSTAMVTFTENQFQVTHNYCSDGFITSIKYGDNDNFINANGGVALLGECGFPANQYFGRHYSIYLEDDNETAKNPFIYDVTESDGQTLLIVTNADGDQAFYGDTELATNIYLHKEFVFYPNPVNDILTFSNLGINEIYDLKVYDLRGNNVSNVGKQNWSENSLNVSQYPAGFYLVKIWLKEGGVLTQKFVKI